MEYTKILARAFSGEKCPEAQKTEFMSLVNAWLACGDDEAVLYEAVMKMVHWAEANYDAFVLLSFEPHMKAICDTVVQTKIKHAQTVATVGRMNDQQQRELAWLIKQHEAKPDSEKQLNKLRNWFKAWPESHAYARQNGFGHLLPQT